MKGPGHRLAAGGRIDRGTRLAFTFDGRPFEGHPGDTLASALIANGVDFVGRSFKYHRLSLIHISEPTRRACRSRMPSSA